MNINRKKYDHFEISPYILQLCATWTLTGSIICHHLGEPFRVRQPQVPQRIEIFTPACFEPAAMLRDTSQGLSSYKLSHGTIFKTGDLIISI